MGTDDEHDDDFGRCPKCGDAWFAITRPPDVVPGATSAQGELVPAGVCINLDGTVAGYSGVLTCLECGEMWRSSDPQRPFLRLIQDEEMEAGFEDIVADNEDLEVVSFTAHPNDYLPEITASGFDVAEFDRALALAVKGVVSMALTSLGFFATDDEEEYEDEGEGEEEW